MLNIRSDELKVVGFFEDANQNNCVNIVGAHPEKSGQVALCPNVIGKEL